MAFTHRGLIVKGYVTHRLRARQWRTVTILMLFAKRAILNRRTLTRGICLFIKALAHSPRLFRRFIPVLVLI